MADPFIEIYRFWFAGVVRVVLFSGLSSRETQGSEHLDVTVFKLFIRHDTRANVNFG